tara:strand:- start:396 stop:650 length:255 start_codon:yes stop_codon:yes gene_type:complete
MSDDETKKGKVVSSCNIYERQFYGQGHEYEGYEYYHNEMHNPIAIVLKYEDGSKVIEMLDKERFATCFWAGDSRDMVEKAVTRS